MENGNTGTPGVATTHALTTTPTALQFGATPIRVDGDMVCLTDMWRGSGSESTKRPNDWRGQEATRILVEHLATTQGCSEPFRAVRNGADLSTFAHWHLAMAYAKYLSPAFHVWCNDVVKAHMEGKVLEARGVRAVASPNSAHLRALTASRRIDLEEKKLTERAFAALAKRLHDAGRTELALVIDVKRAEAISGESLAFALPPAEHHDWKSPTEIAKMLGTNANVIGRTISALKIRGDIPGTCKPIMNKAPGHDREVTSYVYSATAIDQIRTHLKSFSALNGGAE
jgi:hypothetical protein